MDNDGYMDKKRPKLIVLSSCILIQVAVVVDGGIVGLIMIDLFHCYGRIILKVFTFIL